MDVKYLRRVLAGVLTALVCLGIAAYLTYHVVRYFSGDISTVVASDVSERYYLDCEGYIFRDEKLLTVPSAGYVYPLYGNGEKVSRDSIVLNVYSSEDDTGKMAEISRLENTIGVLKESNVTGVASDAGVLGDRVDACMTELRPLVSDGDLSGILEVRDRLLVYLNRAQVLSGAMENFDEQIDAAEAEVEALRGSLGAVSYEIVAERSGYYFSSADGCESIFTLDALEKLTPAGYKSFVSAASSAVLPSGCVGKMTADFRWYLTVSVAKSYSEQLNSGDECSVMFRDNADTVIDMNVERVIFDPGEPEAILVLSTRETPEGFDFERCQRLRILETEYNGYRVPSSAVRIVDGVQGVYILDGGFVRFRRIEVIYRTEGYVIVSPRESIAEAVRGEYLNRNDCIITNGKELYDGKIIVG